MNDKFDELSKDLAKSVTRRRALRKFAAGFAGVVLASFGLANNAQAKGGGNCNNCSGDYGCAPTDFRCVQRCARKCCVICN